MNPAVRFIRKDGRIIPIAAAGGAKVAHAAVSGAGASLIKQHGLNKGPIQPKQSFNVAGLGLSVASGIVGAATFAGGLKGVIGGSVASHALDAAGIAANVASVAGRGQFKERAKQAAKQETRNFVIGNAVFAAGVLGFKKNRQAAAAYAAKGIEYGQKVLSLARRTLRVV